MPVILATQEAEIRRIASLSKQFKIPYLEKTHLKVGLVECLTVKGLSSNPTTTRKKKKKKQGPCNLDSSSRGMLRTIPSCFTARYFFH
jgi:hypothetical protein